MNQRRPINESLLALFALGVVLFNPPLLLLFSVDATLFGFPALYIYIFASWALLVVLVSMIVNRRSRSPGMRTRVGRARDG